MQALEKRSKGSIEEEFLKIKDVSTKQAKMATNEFGWISDRLDQTVKENLTLKQSRDDVILKKIIAKGVNDWIQKYKSDTWFLQEKNRVDNFCKLPMQYQNFPNDIFEFTEFPRELSEWEDKIGAGFIRHTQFDKYGNVEWSSQDITDTFAMKECADENGIPVREICLKGGKIREGECPHKFCDGTEWTRIYGQPKPKTTRVKEYTITTVSGEGREFKEGGITYQTYEDNPWRLKSELREKENREKVKQTVDGIVNARCSLLRDLMNNIKTDIDVIKKIRPDFLESGNEDEFAETVAFLSENYRNFIHLLYDSYEDVALNFADYIDNSTTLRSAMMVVKTQMDTVNWDAVTLDYLQAKVLTDPELEPKVTEIGKELAKYTETEDIAEMMEEHNDSDYAQMVRDQAKMTNFQKYFL